MTKNLEQIPDILLFYRNKPLRVGFSGGADSSMKRKALLKKLDFPEHMSANALLQALDLLYDLEALKQMVTELASADGE